MRWVSATATETKWSYSALKQGLHTGTVLTGISSKLNTGHKSSW